MKKIYVSPLIIVGKSVMSNSVLASSPMAENLDLDPKGTTKWNNVNTDQIYSKDRSGFYSSYEEETEW